MNTFIRSFVLSIVMLTASFSALAHKPASSEYYLFINEQGVMMDAYFPLDRIDYALGVRIAHEEDFRGADLRSQLQQRLDQHLWLADDQGNRIRAQIRQTWNTWKDQNGTNTPMLKAELWFPLADTDGRITLHSDVITAAVSNHDLYVSVQSDFRQGVLGEPALLGVITKPSPQLYIERDGASLWQGVSSMFVHGMDHIRHGTDHLLFLFCLLLTAPLMLVNGRWQGRLTNRQSVIQIVKLISAFTLGHTLTLVMATLGWIPAGGQAIEVVIALTIMATAVFALRPLPFGHGGQLSIAAGFGLIHGAAFAENLAQLGLSGVDLASALLAFTSGIELQQLLLVAVVMPFLLVISRQLQVYFWLRAGAAAFALVASAGWLAERIQQIPNPLTLWLEQLIDIAPYLYALLIVAAVTCWLVQRSRVINAQVPPLAD
ncbi:MAG: hypothetical protein CMI08_02290 [Oceanospirillaceae bacterium]|nr:hypothetical protein [Oceanospirillaceae bacterium]MAX98027.1 hypothetical protein [Oceanospirillaceae bacterium]MBL34432.1 hypothetical protein [Oceanospirillaceae bacterium]MBS52707.1 hypothetical protein [Oceanospirillaceae bacterium]|tara:strand:- start:625 stop:1920 length:1296 start_codon:yes stop_codon:yes gene_type:complete